MLSFRCGQCGKGLAVGDELAGKPVRCPGCNKVVAAPQPAKVAVPGNAAPGNLGLTSLGDSARPGDTPSASAVECTRNDTVVVDEDARKRFESAWRAGTPVTIEKFLTDQSLSHFLATLEELVHIDIEFHWKTWSESAVASSTGRPGAVESYLTRFPQLKRADILQRLVETEFRVRQRLGDKPAAADYRVRFPHLKLARLDPQAGPDVTGFLAPAQKPDELGRLGPYRVLEILGRGGMGVVFKAEDTLLQRMVALKAMLPALAGAPTAKDRFFREARAAASLKHPHIVTIHQVGEDRGAPFLAMEFLEGESLDDRLKREKMLPIAEVLRIGIAVAEGLACAHDKGLIHRDIKPANIWLERNDERRMMNDERKKAADSRSSFLIPHSSFQAKILDFGLARALAEQTQLTQSGAIVGTPAFMAPEQARGEPVDGRCDLFSLGVVLYRMSTGDVPFKGKDTLSLLSALALDTPAEPRQLNPDIPAALNDLIVQLLAKQPAERPAGAAEVVDALRALLTSLALDTPPTPRAIDRAVPTELSDLIMDLMEKDSGRRPASARDVGDRLTRPRQSLAKPREAVARETAPSAITAMDSFKTRPSEAATAPQRPRRRWPIALVAGLFAASLIAASVFFIQTPRGTIRIEINDDNLQATLTKTGATITRADTGREIRVAPSDDQTLKVELKDKQGNRTEFFTDRFQLKSGETVTLKVELLPGVVQVLQGGRVIGKKDLPVGPAEHRRAAELIFSLGGALGVDRDGVPKIKAVQQLPAGPFEITDIDLARKNITDAHVRQLAGLREIGTLSLAHNPEITDASLDVIAAMEELHGLWLDETGVTDAGVKKLVHLKQLRSLSLQQTRATDTSIDTLVSMPSLVCVNISSCSVTKTGLNRLAQKRTWLDLHLMLTPVTDEHLAELAKCERLTDLSLQHVKLTRSGLKWIGQMTKLVKLNLNSTGLTDDLLDPILDLPITFLEASGNPLTDAGAQKLTRLKKMENLYLTNTSVGDTGLAALAGMKLSHLSLEATKVTGPGIDAFLAANPQCSVWHDGGFAQAGKKPATRNHRTAADWALSLGGSVGLTIDAAKGHYQHLKKGDELPPGNWTMTIIVSNKNVTDSSLAELSGATKLRHLVAPNNPITDDGIKHLANHHLMTNLDLDHTQITDAGLKEVLAMKSLAHLRFGGTKVTVLGIEEVVRRPASQFEGLGMSGLPVTDAILKDLTKFRRLTVLYLDRTKVTEEGLKELHHFDDLRTIWLSENRLGDAVVDELLKCPKLDFVSLNGNPISDAGVKKLAQLKSLRHLSIGQTAVTDAGLAELASQLSARANPALKVLVVQGTKVTAKGLAAFHAAVPGCEIQHDGGTIKPNVLVRNDRTAAEWVLWLGAQGPRGARVDVEKDGKTLKVFSGQKLPPDPWILRAVYIPPTKDFTDADLARFSGCSRLKVLILERTSVTDKGLPSLAHMKELIALNLTGHPISDAGLKEIRVLKTLETFNFSFSALTKDGLDHLVREGSPKMRWLHLAGLPVTDAVLKDLTRFSGLTTLNIGKTQVTDAGLKELSRFKILDALELKENGLSDAAVDALVELPLRGLDLEGNRITDAGMKKLAGIKSLQGLNISNNPLVTDEGLAALHGLGLGRIHINGTKITKKGVAAFRARVPGCTVDYGGRWIEPLAASRNDRTAILWALSMGGIVSIHHKGQSVRLTNVEDLPEGDWTMTIEVAGKNLTDADLIELSGAARMENLVLDWNPALTNACVKHLANLHEMAHLQISGTQLTNAGLKDLLTLKSLGHLNLSSTRVTQAGIEDVIRRPATQFASLGLGALPVTDALLKDLTKFRRLSFLNLSQTQVTEEGLKELRPFKDLNWLIISNNDLSDAVVEELVHLPKLATLELDGNRITDAGFKRLAQIKTLRQITANKTQVTDAGLAALAAQPGMALTSLQVKGTKVTADGVAAFRAAHPKCEIVHDAAAQGSDRTAAEQTLSLGGKVSIERDGATVEIAAMKNLPAGQWVLRTIDLRGKAATDATLKELSGAKGVHSFILSDTQVTDEGVKLLAGRDELQVLFLDGTQVTGATFTSLTASKRGFNINLSRTRVTDEAIKEFLRFEHLQVLNIENTTMTEAGIKYLAGRLPPTMIQLSLGDTPLNDAILKDLMRLENLTYLRVGKTKVTSKGVKEIARLRKLDWLEINHLDLTDSDLDPLLELSLVRLHLDNNPRITDAGIKRLARIKTLQTLVVSNTAMTDEGLLSLAGLRLSDINIVATKVTPKGIAAFHAAVPGCRILHDGGTIPSKQIGPQ